jgi:restriction system protein
MSSRSTSKQSDWADRLILISPWWSLGFAVLGYVALNSLRISVPGLPQNLGAFLAPVWLSLWIMIAVIAKIHQKRRAGILDEQTGLDSLRKMDWKRFEWLVAEAYQRQGYKVDYQLGLGPDGGVDVRLRKDGKLTLVQCKHRQRGTVGAPVVREMFGLMHHEKANAVIITTTSHFTPDAEAFAEGKPITLINGSQLWTLVREVQKTSSLGVAEVPPEIPREPIAAAPPICPKCGGGMHRKHRHADGVPFWACQAYPTCKGTLSI